MKKFVLMLVTAVIANFALAAPPAARPEAPALPKQDYRLPMEQVIVIGQDPYWKRQGQPRWDRSKVDVDLKSNKESRLQLFPNYTAQERDEALKQHDSNRNNTTPKIKLFDVKF